jgi:hypothetical protein
MEIMQCSSRVGVTTALTDTSEYFTYFTRPVSFFVSNASRASCPFVSWAMAVVLNMVRDWYVSVIALEAA